jgi:hypothetical protein
VGVVDLLTSNLVAKSSMNFGLQIYKPFLFLLQQQQQQQQSNPITQKRVATKDVG